MTLKERVKQYCTESEISVSQFEKRAGLSNGYFNQVTNAPGRDRLSKILDAFPDINRDWLLYGEGEMMKSTSPSTPVLCDFQMTPLLPLAAQGGSLNDFVVSVRTDDCEKIISPIKGVDFAMAVSGDSMDPEYPSGSKILIKRINEKAFIEWGRVYVLDTCNGSVIKKLMPGPSTNVVECQSINPLYPSFEVSFVDIYGIYRVLMCMSEK